jgi:DnaK suppressor protein
MDPEHARRRLGEERGRVEEALGRLGGDRDADEQRDSGDQAVMLDQEERDEAVREELQRTLDAIERAERRLEEGTYGLSILSGEPIPEERLELIPWAEHTVAEENRRGG